MSAVIDEARTAAPVARLRVEGLSKTFPGVQALTDVTVEVLPGEVHALVGPNGSGKSTFIKVISGFQSADPGARAWLGGEEMAVAQLADAGQGAPGLAFVHQDLGLVLELSVLDNFALRTGFSRTRFGTLGKREQAKVARDLLDRLGVQLDLNALMSQLTPVERTMSAIAMALHNWEPETGVLVLDEPTASLPFHEVQRLSTVVQRLRDRGAAIIYVSHRLDEVLDLADRVTVLRNGRLIVTSPISGLSKQSLVKHMLGHDVPVGQRPAPSTQVGTDAALEVEGLSGVVVTDASFRLARGEVLGVSGLIGSGSDELPRLLTDRTAQATEGRFRTGTTQWQNVQGARTSSLALVPPDRGREGILPAMSVQENMSISVVGTLTSGPWLRRSSERDFAARWVEALDVVTSGLNNRIENLSGGNQQKVIIGRTLAREPGVLVLCEPTAGVDVGAREAIYALVRAHLGAGLGVIVSSSDTTDLLELCDRVLVFRDGRICAEIAADELSEKRLVASMEGAYEGEADEPLETDA